MIFNKSEYNPLPAIKALQGGEHPLSLEFIDLVKKELFLGGVVPETDEEFEQILVLLVDMEIIDGTKT